VTIGGKAFEGGGPVAASRTVDNPCLGDGGCVDIQFEIVTQNTEPGSIALKPGNGSAMCLNHSMVAHRADKGHALPDNVLEHVLHNDIVYLLSQITAHRTQGRQTRYLEVLQQTVKRIAVIHLHPVAAQNPWGCAQGRRGVLNGPDGWPAGASHSKLPDHIKITPHVGVFRANYLVDGRASRIEELNAALPIVIDCPGASPVLEAQAQGQILPQHASRAATGMDVFIAAMALLNTPIIAGQGHGAAQ